MAVNIVRQSFIISLQQKKLAERSKAALEKFFKQPIKTLILPAETFYPAEEYHQGFCEKQPERYSSYAKGHEKPLHKIWKEIPYYYYGKDDVKDWLTPLQYQVTQKEYTEPPFDNPFWDNKEEGLYVDALTGEPLFYSNDKFESGTGWPSFTQPVEESAIETHEDWKLGTLRIELRSKSGQCHLGHLFPDGPGPAGLRYCINSAALRFIPKGKLKERGYTE